MQFCNSEMRDGFVRHFACAIASSHKGPYRSARRAILCLIVFAGLGHLVKLVVFAGTPQALIRSDITQDYVMGRAVVNGADPRLPFPDLVRIFLGEDAGTSLPGPSPHTPLIALLFLPFSVLPLNLVHQVWVLVSAACAFGAFFVLGDLFRVRNRGTTALLWTSLAIVSCPGRADLLFGQWNFPQLFLLSLFLNAYDKGQHIKSAAYLAFSFAMRPVVVPLCLYALIVTKGGFRVAFALVSGVIAVALFIVFGSGAMLAYPSTVRDVVLLWEGSWSNISLRSLIPNLVVPRSGEFYQDFITPILPAPLPEGLMAFGTGLAACLGLASVWKARGREPRYAMLSLFVISPMLSPIAWHHYLTFLFVPIFLDGWRLVRQPGWRSRLALGAMILPLVYPASAIFDQIAFDGFSDVPTVVGISWLGRSVFPVLTISVALAWAAYPLPKRMYGELSSDASTALNSKRPSTD